MDTYHFYVMSDLHLSSKTGRLCRALEKCRDGQFVLMTGDLTNDGKAAQFTKLKELVEERLPDMPVFAVSGNHDYPVEPLPQIKTETCDYVSFQEWLQNRLNASEFQCRQDGSGGYAVKFGNLDIIGLNAATHWRRFVFPKGRQLKWLEEYLEQSTAVWHVILCHAPLAAHGFLKRSGVSHPYLSRDQELQQILDRHRNVLFFSGHTHISPAVWEGACDTDLERRHLYVNAGSICKTTLRNNVEQLSEEWADGNIVEVRIQGEEVEVNIRLLHQKLGILYYM